MQNVLNENYCDAVTIYHFNYVLLLTIPLHSFITIVVLEFVWYYYQNNKSLRFKQNMNICEIYGGKKGFGAFKNNIVIVLVIIVKTIAYVI